MAKKHQVLDKVNVTSADQRALYIYGLTEALSSVQGIGRKRLGDLEEELAAQYNGAKLPSTITWVYHLTLDILQEPMRAQELCTTRENGCSLLEQFRTIDADTVRTVVSNLKSTLSSNEYNTIIRLYRDGYSPARLAKEISGSTGSVRSTKNRAITKLRKPHFANTLKELMFWGTNQDEA